MLVYLSGGMGGLTYTEQLSWRNKFISGVLCKLGTDSGVGFFNPPLYYSPSKSLHKSEREVMEYDLGVLRKSDVVVVNFNIPESIGTAMEVAVARELKIPIIGVNALNKQLHPWLSESCMRMCETFDEAEEYLVDYFGHNPYYNTENLFKEGAGSE